MNCPNCGAFLREGVRFCPNCGQVIDNKAKCSFCGTEYNPEFHVCPNCGNENESVTRAAAFSAQSQNGTISKKEWISRNASKEKKTITIISIITYILAVGIFGYNMSQVGPYLSYLPASYTLILLIDPFIIIGTTIGIQITKNKGFAIALLAYAIINTVILLAQNGSFGGWWWLAAGISQFISANKIDKEYKAFIHQS